MPTDDRSQVLAAIDIVELIGQTVSLKRRGKDFQGLCPFHQEKTPSFHVNPTRQSFYCFGCKAGGTAFDFVMKRDRVEFKEALEILARLAGIELKAGRPDSPTAGQRQAVLDANSASAGFFESQLRQPPAGPISQNAAAALQYLSSRGFTDATLRQFRVGLAPEGWDNLLNSVVGRKLGASGLAQAGLVKIRENGSGHYDTFRHRIMFPIRNEGGQIIAFGGRVMPGSEDPAKYLNSPETPVFSKSRSIFAIDLARQKIVETRTAAVVEGYTDVMMAHQFGASNVVSVLGTAMTEQHVGILRRFADRIVLLFDADTAGGAAVDRVLQLFLTQPVEIAVASLPEGLDPDEFLLKEGLPAFDALLASAPDALSYAWKQFARKYVSNAEDMTGQQKAVREYLELLGGVHSSSSADPLRWAAALSRVAKLIGTPVEELHRRFKPARKAAGPRSVITVAPATAEAEGTHVEVPAAEEPMDRTSSRTRAEMQALGALLLEPHRWPGIQLTLVLEDFVHPRLKRLAEVYWDHQQHEGEPVFNQFLDRLSAPEMKVLALELTELVEGMEDLDGALREAVDHLKELRRIEQQRRLAARAQSAGGDNLSEEQQIDLLRQAQEHARRPDLRRVAWT